MSEPQVGGGAAAERAVASPLGDVRRDLVANFLSSIWMPVLWVVTVPQYVLAMGAESFGLVGLFTTMQSIVALFDMGLSMTLNREFARLVANGTSDRTMRDTLRTMEAVYWAVGLLIGLAGFATAGVIAHHWLHPEALSVDAVTHAMYVMAGALALQWPLTLYSGGMMGIGRQASLAAINIVFLTIRFAGVLPVLWFVSASPTAFFLYQGSIGFVHTLFVAGVLWRSLPARTTRAALRPALLRHQLHFAFGLFGFSVIEVLLTQLDKVVLSKLLSLEMFGYYSMASLVAMALYRLFSPVFASVYPRFTQLLELRRQAELRTLYHRACEVIAVLDCAVAVPLVVFPREALFVWIGDHLAANAVGAVMALLVIGTAVRGLVFVPHALQLAAGWPGLSVRVSLAALVVFVPFLMIAALQFGAAGAAVSWIVLNVGYTGTNVWLMHQRLLPGERGAWLGRDVLLPLIGPVLVTLAARYILPDDLGRAQWAAALAVVFLSSLVAATAGASPLRASVADKLRKTVRAV